MWRHVRRRRRRRARSCVGRRLHTASRGRLARGRRVARAAGLRGTRAPNWRVELRGRSCRALPRRAAWAA
eukprot:3968141-Prymnesium_polylepis.1